LDRGPVAQGVCLAASQASDACSRGAAVTRTARADPDCNPLVLPCLPACVVPCSDTDTPCFNQVPAEIALKIVNMIKVGGEGLGVRMRLGNGVAWLRPAQVQVGAESLLLRLLSYLACSALRCCVRAAPRLASPFACTS
jgi:hypothetical protein